METPATKPPAGLSPESLVPHLKRCGYDDALLRISYDFGSGCAPVAAFAHTPHDVRSVCIAVIEAPSDPQTAVVTTRRLGAPVVLACHKGALQWWKQTPGVPLLVESISKTRIPAFFRRHKGDFGPGTIFEGKTRRRLPGQTQLSFVDAGLMPFVEQVDGERLTRLVEAAFRRIEATLGRELKSNRDVRNAIKATFWLLAAKALRDKEASGFKTVDLTSIDDVFARVGKHYGVPEDVPPRGRAWHEATTQAAERIGGFGSLCNLSTESLAHVYENALVTPEVRKASGTHSTPGPLVDYIVWQLWPWIEALPLERRHVFEPACGHAAFLVSALRVLRQWSGIDDSKACHDYLKKHLHGVEYDEFALEVARLSLTLADAPHGNTWDLKQADMFLGTGLEARARKCGVLLANPPFERFTRGERTKYGEAGVSLGANTKACEMLRRTIPHLTEGACFGVVVPQGLLHSPEGTALRRTILSKFELAEIDIFGDKLFEKGEHETAVLLGRRKTGKARSDRFWFRRARNAGIAAFRDRFAFASEELMAASHLPETALADFRVPELGSIWTSLCDSDRLEKIARVSKGLDFRARALPRGTWRIHETPEPNDDLGYGTRPIDLEICGLPKAVGMNLGPRAVQVYRAGRPTGQPRVLVPYIRVGREAWRLKAVIDPEGRGVTSTFLVAEPRTPSVSPLYLWSILNSPVANAFVHTHTQKRQNLTSLVQSIPVPRWSQAHAAHIEQAAMRYRTVAGSPGSLFEADATSEGIRRALLEMDAAVLRVYDLPPRLERQLLDLFAGVPRKGVGCTFTGYYPPGFTSCLPLHLVISQRFQRAAANVTADRFRPGRSAHVRDALAAAARNQED